MGRILMTGICVVSLFDVLRELVLHLIEKNRFNHSCVSSLPNFVSDFVVMWSAHQNLLQEFNEKSINNEEISPKLVNKINMLKGYICTRSLEIISTARQFFYLYLFLFLFLFLFYFFFLFFICFYFFLFVLIGFGWVDLLF